MNNLTFSLISIEKTSTKYLEKFDVLKILLVNEKLMVNDNALCLDESYYLIQPFKRWLTNQNRISICEYLKNEFENYFVFMDMINTALSTNLSMVERHKIKNIKNKHEDFNKNIKDGLNNLHVTYSDYEDGAMIISSIILKLQEFIVNSVDEVD